MRVLIILSLLIMFVSCQEDAKTPEGLLRMYITDITSKKVDRDYFETYTTGKMLEHINTLSDEEFNSFVDLSKVRSPKLEISNKNCEGEKCSLTYVIKYDVVLEDKKEFQSEVKKVASLIKDGETWKISEVSNIKTFHDSLIPINALED